MKVRGFIIIAILIGGLLAMGKSFDDGKERSFLELLQPMNEQFDSLSFTIPASFSPKQENWIIEEVEEIESLLTFLQDYHVRKLNPDEINIYDNTKQFSVSLNGAKGNTLEIIADDNVIIQNASLYYEIVDGPLDVHWLVQFFIHNQF